MMYPPQFRIVLPFSALCSLLWTTACGFLCRPHSHHHALQHNHRGRFPSRQHATKREYGVKIINSIAEFDRDAWNFLLDDKTSSPFMEYDWIYAMEASGCASVDEGWQPLHIGVYEMLREGDQTEATQFGPLMAACPLYVKYNSMGEFIFDHAWADYAQRALGIKYYPKLLSAVPFTPATGSRLLVHPSLSASSSANDGTASGSDSGTGSGTGSGSSSDGNSGSSSTSRLDNNADAKNDQTPTLPSEVATISRAVAGVMQQLVRENQLSSAHVNFMLTDEIDPYLQAGFQLRETIQYRWENLNRETGRPYADFEDYLSAFKSKRRMQIKRERRAVFEEQGIRIEAIRGGDVKATAELYQIMYEIYTTTVEKMWGQQYLSSAFFQKLFESPASFRHNLLFVVAYNSANQVIAGTVNLVKANKFYGRYWGCFEFRKNLHFEACYYTAIEYCIQHGIEYFEPGAGGGEFKYLRGFDPYLVSSVHHFRSPVLGQAVGDFLVAEREKNQMTADYLIANSAVAGKGGGGGGDYGSLMTDDD